MSRELGCCELPQRPFFWYNWHMEIDRQEFLDRMSAVMERPVALDTRFRETEGWSSLKAFGLLVTLENDFGRAMNLDEFKAMDTIGDLLKAAGER